MEEINEEEIMEEDREEEAIKDSEEDTEEEVQGLDGRKTLGGEEKMEEQMKEEEVWDEEVTRIPIICPEEEAKMLKVNQSPSPTDSTQSHTHTDVQLILALVLYLHEYFPPSLHSSMPTPSHFLPHFLPFPIHPPSFPFLLSVVSKCII